MRCFSVISDKAAWKQVLERLENRDDVFSSQEYFSLFEDRNSKPELFIFEENGGIFVLPYLKYSIPGYEYCDFETGYGYSGPLSSNSDAYFINEAWRAFQGCCRNSGIVAGFIRFNPLTGNHALAGNIVRLYKDRKVVVLDITGQSIEGIWKTEYSSNNRNKIQMALKNNVEVKTGDDIQALGVFHQMYLKTMDRLGADDFYRFEWAFFEKMEKLLKGSFTVLLGYKDGIPIASSLLLYGGNIITYFLSATEDEARKIGAANLLRHEAVLFGRQKGIRHINFGGGKTSAEDDSLLRFKSGFSKDSADFYYGTFLSDADAYNSICRDWEGKSTNDKKLKYGGRFLKYKF